MIKIRFDVLVAIFILLFAAMGGNALFPYERGLYKEYLKTESEEEDAAVVSDLQELLAAAEEGTDVILEVPKKSIKGTKLYGSHTGAGKSMFKYNALAVMAEFVLSGTTYDRLYLVDMGEEKQILVRIYPRAVSLSGKTVKLPIGRITAYDDFEDIDKDLGDHSELVTSQVQDGYLLVDTSDFDYSLEEKFEEKGKTVKSVTLGGIIIAVVLYMIISTVVLVKAHRRRV